MDGLTFLPNYAFILSTVNVRKVLGLNKILVANLLNGTYKFIPELVLRG
jgi:hypothetical protein